MIPVYKKSIFIFRRDLRIEDNTGLRKALELSKEVAPCFIIDPQQVGSQNIFRSMHAIQFMVESLKDLDLSLKKKGGKLSLFYGTPEEVVEKIIHTEKIDALFLNEDYTPYSRHRDAQLESLCKKAGVAFISSFDLLLVSPQDGMADRTTPYKVFTPFYKKNSAQPIQKPVHQRSNNYTQHPLSHQKNLSFLDSLFPTEALLRTQGGRDVGLKILATLSTFNHYEATHNLVSLPSTGLSAHIKFGTLSIREVAHSILNKLGPGDGLLRQLYWRDFFHHIAWFYPHVFGNAFHTKYNQLPWNTNVKDFKRWCEGTTGFPLVDAGMRELNETGFMHNRARLVVGSFLTKDLHISWQWGERYFAQQLEDYDPCVNNGNWQWVASTGCDAQPYFRIFNPWLQQKKYDPECVYIKKWVPELKNVQNKIIHTWHKQTSSSNGYPPPMVDHGKESAVAKKLYKKISLSKIL